MGMKIKGDQELMDKLSALRRLRPEAQRKALYAGAKVMADALTQAVGELPIDSSKLIGIKVAGYHKLNVISPKDRAELQECVGVAVFRDNGDVTDTLVGFNGYLKRKEKNYPNGVPAALIVRSIESGSSVRAEHPFIKKTMRGAKKAAIAAMDAAAGEELGKAK